ncbi:MAG: CocE/NonD family hydrolase [Polaromonas sp.]
MNLHPLLRSACGFVAAAAFAAVAHAQTASTTDPVAELVKITVPGMGTFGSDAAMVTHVFKPAGAGPFPVLLFSHGRAGDAATRSKLTNPLALGHVRYWLNKGYAVVAPVRPGYGDTGGSDTESSGSTYSATGECRGLPDPSRTAKAAVRSVSVALDWVRAQPWTAANKILLQGQSVGGLTTVAFCATSPPGVVGCINFAGGVGGNPDTAPARMCSPEVTTALMAEFGRTTKLPNIWLYAENDLYWGAEPPKQWHAAFAQGANPTEFVQTTAVQPDGHQLLLRGGRLWSEPLNAWLKRHGF